MKSTLRAALAAVLAFAAFPAFAAVQTKTVEYRDGDTVLKGYLAWDDATSAKRPGVVVMHEWWGLNDYAKGRARQLAAMGYVAFAADMYGDGKLTEHPEEAGKWSGEIAQNLPVGLRRARLALDQLLAVPAVDAGKTAAIGYCFGGAVVLHMAYDGMPLRGVASFHSSLPAVPEGKTVAAKVFAAHGASDAFLPKEKVDAFVASLEKAKADWQLLMLGGAVHSFTVPAADAHKIPGLAYNEAADRRSWAALQDFFGELFGR